MKEDKAMKTIVINFNQNGTMTDGYLRLPDGTRVILSNWKAYDLYTRLATSGRKVVSVLHNDLTSTDSINF